MGRIWTTVLLLASACGDNLDTEFPDGAENGVDNDGVGSPTARYAPQVCGISAWDPSFTLDPAIDVSVVARPGGGATLLSTPLAGGDLLGFQLSPRMDGGAVTKVPIYNAQFAGVTVSYIQDRVISTAVADGGVYVHMLDDNLMSPQYIAKLPATSIGDPAFYYVQGNLVMPTATTEGMVMYRFDDSLEPLDSKLFKATKPASTVTSAQLGTNLMTAWSTDTECHLMINTTYEPGMTARVGAACPSPRIAVDQFKGNAVMLFESVEGIRMMPIYLSMFGGDAPVLRADATSPRVLFDGKRFWISYLDTRGDVIVGYLDEDMRPKTLSLGDPQPERSAYELIMLDGRPTIFSAEETGYKAYSLCAVGTE